MQIGLKCVFIRHADPHLKLGPFKFELLHLAPEIGLIHEFVSKKEAETIKMLARGKMRSTPYISMDNGSQNYSKQRTSKVIYMNENLVPGCKTISNRIEWLTLMKMKHEIFASENFQIMNYGIGGKISAHVDAFGEIFTNSSIGKFDSIKQSK